MYFIITVVVIVIILLLFSVKLYLSIGMTLETLFIIDYNTVCAGYSATDLSTYVKYEFPFPTVSVAVHCSLLCILV